MVPGMTERERCAAGLRLLAWLADATRGLTHQATAAVGLPRSHELEPQTVCRRAFALALRLRGPGRRFQLRAAARAPYAATKQMTA